MFSSAHGPEDGLDHAGHLRKVFITWKRCRCLKQPLLHFSSKVLLG